MEHKGTASVLIIFLCIFQLLRMLAMVRLVSGCKLTGAALTDVTNETGGRRGIAI